MFMQHIKINTTVFATHAQTIAIRAGVAAIVRQYFREGRLMNGIREGLVKSPFLASAALMKAVILHSGKELSLYQNDGSYSKKGILPTFSQVCVAKRVYLVKSG